MKTRIIILFILIGLCTFSCKKEDVSPNSEGEVVLFTNMALDGEFMEIRAGIDRYYNEASYNNPTDSINVGYFSSKFHLEDDPEAGPSIEFRFRNHQVGNIISADIGESINPGNAEYYSVQSAPYYSTRFTIQAEGGDNNFTLNYGDGKSGNDLISQHYYRVDGPNKYTASLNSNCGFIEYDVVMPSFPFSHVIERESMDSSLEFFNYHIDNPDNHAYSYLWEFDGGITATTSEVKYKYPGGSEKIEHAKLNIIDNRNNSIHLEKKFHVGSSNNCFSNFTYSVDTIVNLTNLEGLGQVEIIYINELGKVYSSFLGNQNENSSLNILEINDYKNNLKGQKTKRIQLEFSCTLFSSSGDSLLVENGMSRLAVAYP